MFEGEWMRARVWAGPGRAGSLTSVASGRGEGAKG